MLCIEDISKIRITKVTMHCVYFKYEDRMFFIKGSSEDFDCSYNLYERVRISENRFNVKRLSGVVSGDDDVSRLLILKKGIKDNPCRLRCNHNQFDIYSFVLKLMNFGLVTGSADLTNELDSILFKVSKNNRHIADLTELISKLRLENLNLMRFQQEDEGT